MTKTDGRFWMHRVKHARKLVAAFLLGIGKLVDGNESLDGNWGGDYFWKRRRNMVENQSCHNYRTLSQHLTHFERLHAAP